MSTANISNTVNTSNTTADVKMDMGIAKEMTDMTDDVISKINDLYITYRGRFTIVSQGGFYSPKGKAGYLKLKNANIWSHLQRTYAVAVYCGKSGSKFVCFDIDDGDSDTVSSVVNGIGEATGISRDFIYVSYSGGKGYHVEVFFDDLVPMECMRKLYRTVIKRKELNPKKVEFRPTPSQSIKLPLSVHQRTGNICWFVDRDTLEPIESYEYIFGIKQCSAELFQDFVNDIDPDEGTETEADGRDESSGQKDACEHDLREGNSKGGKGALGQGEGFQVEETGQWAQSLAAIAIRDGFSVDDLCNSLYPLEEEGTRHDRMLGIALYFRSHNMAIDNIKKMLMKWYKDQDQSLISSTEKEVLDDIDKICDWVVARDHKDRLFANITKNELAYLMSIGSKAQRRIAFFLYSCVVAKSKFTIAYEKLGEYIGASHVTVIGGVDLLVDRGIIHRKKQKRKIGESGYYNTYPNIYSLERSAHAEIEDRYVKNEAVQVSVYSLIHNFFETYYAALNYMFTDAYLKKVLSKAEFVEYRKTVDHMREVSESKEANEADVELKGTLIG